MTKIESFSQVSAQNQTTEGLFKKSHTNLSYDSAALNWLLLVTKSLNWEKKILKQKLEILKLKIDA